jgi:hypothetical protein
VVVELDKMLEVVEELEVIEKVKVHLIVIPLVL